MINEKDYLIISLKNPILMKSLDLLKIYMYGLIIYMKKFLYVKRIY